MYLPLDAADEPEKILRSWLSQAPGGSRREAQVKDGNNGTETGCAFMMPRERSVHVANTAEAHDGAESEVNSD